MGDDIQYESEADRILHGNVLESTHKVDSSNDALAPDKILSTNLNNSFDPNESYFSRFKNPIKESTRQIYFGFIVIYTFFT